MNRTRMFATPVLLAVVIVKFSETNRGDRVSMLCALADVVMAPQHLAEINRLDAPLLAAR